MWACYVLLSLALPETKAHPTNEKTTLKCISPSAVSFSNRRARQTDKTIQMSKRSVAPLKLLSTAHYRFLFTLCFSSQRRGSSFFASLSSLAGIDAIYFKSSNLNKYCIDSESSCSFVSCPRCDFSDKHSKKATFRENKFLLSFPLTFASLWRLRSSSASLLFHSSYRHQPSRPFRGQFILIQPHTPAVRNRCP